VRLKFKEIEMGNVVSKRVRKGIARRNRKIKMGKKKENNAQQALKVETKGKKEAAVNRLWE